MKSNPLVSIIIPVFKVEDYIETSLKSALDQSYANIEIILVDDCTPDNSISICKAICRFPEYQSKRIIIHSLDKNGGLSNARNEGLRIANGEYVFFMDSDDSITEDCIKLHVEHILKYNGDFTDGNVRINGSKHNNFLPYNNGSRIEGEEVLKSYFNNIHVCGWNKLIKKDFLLENNIFFKKGMLYEDMLWVYQLCRFADSYITVPYETYNYLIREGSITTKNNDPQHSIRQFNSFLDLLSSMDFQFKMNANKELKLLETKWISKILLIIKGRLLMAPLSRSEKKYIHNQLRPYAKNTTGLYGKIHRLSYPVFSLIFKIPNYIFRKIRG